MEKKAFILDDDKNITELLRFTLEQSNYKVLTYPGENRDLPGLRQFLYEAKPDIAILDVDMPGGVSGLEILKNLREDVRFIHLPVVFLSGSECDQNRAEAYGLFAEDFISKPFKREEFLLRLKGIIARKEALINSNTLTHLPGAPALEREIKNRLVKREAFSTCYLDISDFKAYNDHYGFEKGDGVIRYVAELLKEVLYKNQNHNTPGFICHIGGDDFVFLTDPRLLEPACRKIINKFDSEKYLFYEYPALQQGGITARDRNTGKTRLHKIMRLAIGACDISGAAENRDYEQLISAVSKMKLRAKQFPESTFLSDRYIS